MLHLLPDRPVPARSPAPRPDDLDPALLTQPVLIVEDEAMIAWTLETMLEEIGFTDITLAASGELAIELARRTPPRLVLSDINLGPHRMDGVAAAAAILLESSPTVVFVTGNGSDEARRRIEAALPGAVLLGKPVGPADLARGIALAFAPKH